MSHDKLKLLKQKTDQFVDDTYPTIQEMAQREGGDQDQVLVMWYMSLALVRATLYMMHERERLPFERAPNPEHHGMMADTRTVHAAQAKMLLLISQAHKGMTAIPDPPTMVQ